MVRVAVQVALRVEGRLATTIHGDEAWRVAVVVDIGVAVDAEGRWAFAAAVVVVGRWHFDDASGAQTGSGSLSSGVFVHRGVQA